MKRFLGHALSVVTVGVVALVAAPACVENNQSIYIQRVLAPPTARVNNVCQYTADPQALPLFEGVLDGAVRDTYVAVMMVGSQLIPRGDNTQTRAEPNRSYINGFVIKITEPDGETEIGEFTSTASGFLDPAQATQPDLDVVATTVLDATTTGKLIQGISGTQTKLVVANIKAFGKTLGGVDLESGEFQFPIRVCNGCLITFDTADDPATPNVRECNRPSDVAGTLPCTPGQDEFTPCFTCSATRPACKGGATP
jgi:hypothetical protein